MEIWRAIFLDSLNELDKFNFGCHWTKDDLYYLSMEFAYNDISENKRKGKNLYLFQTSVNKNQIDKKATYKSNVEHPSESECVLKINTILPKVVLIFPEKNIKPFEANSGNRLDNWI